MNNPKLNKAIKICSIGFIINALVLAYTNIHDINYVPVESYKQNARNLLNMEITIEYCSYLVFVIGIVWLFLILFKRYC